MALGFIENLHMKALIPIVALVLASCGTAEVPNPHDTKYSSVDVDGDRCILDNVTGLTWEVKSTDTGLHNRDNTYSWFDPDEAVGELDYRGVENGGTCDGSDCDTWHFVAAINLTNYCGHNDWRMPSKDELFSISDKTRVDSPPTVNHKVFPNTRSAEYWSGNDYSFQYDAAWGWNFELGHDRVDWKRTPKPVRLVRGTATQLEAVKE